MTRHYPLPYRMRRKAETYHFKGISLLTSLGALNMMEFTFVIGISQVTGMPMNF